MSGSMKMMEALEEVASIVTEVTQGQDLLGDQEDRQHNPQSAKDQYPGLNIGGDLDPRGRGQGRRLVQRARSWTIALLILYWTTYL